jgi:maleylacetate reductase
VNTMQFVYMSRPATVVFGPGSSAKVSEWLDKLGCKSALVLSTPQQEDQAIALARQLGGKAAGTFSPAQQCIRR